MASVNGLWIGWGKGDKGPKILSMKLFLADKFEWVENWTPKLVMDENFDENFEAVVLSMQLRYKDIPVNGLMDAKTQERCGFYKPEPVDRLGLLPIMFTVCGTGVPWWVGPDADLARDLEYIWKTKPDGLFRWQPIGYPAKPIPMGRSITEGKNELLNQLELHREQVEKFGAVFVGYSQGAVITSEVWEKMKRDGHWAVPHIFAAVTFGNPSREFGKVWPDFAPGQRVAPANTSGVAYPADRLKNTPEWWRDYAHDGDLYATAAQGDSGQDKTAIWRIIRGEQFLVGPDTLAEQVMEIASNPFKALGAFRAMFDALNFFGKQLVPHTSYNPWPARDYLRACAIARSKGVN